MEASGEDDEVLQEGIAELTLDRPPSCPVCSNLSSSPSRNNELSETLSSTDVTSNMTETVVNVDGSPSNFKRKLDGGNVCTCHRVSLVRADSVGDSVDISDSSINEVEKPLQIDSTTSKQTDTRSRSFRSNKLVTPILKKPGSAKTPKKHVLIPEDGKCVTEMIDPVDPWRNG